MEKLSSNWFVEGRLDFEYKKYTLLAYLQHVQREFAEVKLYPSFGELIHHYNNLQRFRSEKSELQRKFPKSLSEEDIRQLRLLYKPAVEDGGELQEVEAIIDFSLPEIKERLEEGKDLYEHVEKQLSIEPIGISPLHNREGFLLVHMEPRPRVSAYTYRISFFENVEGNYYGISLNHLADFQKSLVNTFEAIKLSLLRTYREYANPATYLVTTRSIFPREAAFMPVAKRKFLSYVGNSLA